MYELRFKHEISGMIFAVFKQFKQLLFFFFFFEKEHFLGCNGNRTHDLWNTGTVRCSTGQLNISRTFRMRNG